MILANAVFDLITLLSAALTVALALIHLFVGRLEFLNRPPRSRWLSFASGVSIAYVFVQIIPETHDAGIVIKDWEIVRLFAEDHVYLIMLVGFIIFYGLEQHVRKPTSLDQVKTKSNSGVFWIHVGSFAAYNILIGYLLVHQEDPDVVGLVTYAIAIALHFVVNDYGLRFHHGQLYHDSGRWILATAVIAGFSIGYLVDVSEAFVSVLLAFLAGGMIINTIKEELPSERESRFWVFTLGAMGYAALLLFV